MEFIVVAIILLALSELKLSLISFAIGIAILLFSSIKEIGVKTNDQG